MPISIGGENNNVSYHPAPNHSTPYTNMLNVDLGLPSRNWSIELPGMMSACGTSTHPNLVQCIKSHSPPSPESIEPSCSKGKEGRKRKHLCLYTCTIIKQGGEPETTTHTNHIEHEHRGQKFVWQIDCAHLSAHTRFSHK